MDCSKWGNQEKALHCNRKNRSRWANIIFRTYVLGVSLIKGNCCCYCGSALFSSQSHRLADKNSTHLSTLSARSRDRSLSFDRRKTAARGRMTTPRPSSCSRSRSRERSQTDEISKTLSRLHMISPVSGIYLVLWF